jgi:hypothetical protein
MSADLITFHGIEAETEQTELRAFVRFPSVKPEQARQLARALDYEASAGRSVRDGELRQAEDWRRQAREAWSKFRQSSACR